MALTVVKRLICKECQQPIEPLTGVIIQGNVYVVGADPDVRGGIIGNAIHMYDLPLHDVHAPKSGSTALYDQLSGAHPAGTFADRIDEVAFHYHCLRKVLKQHLEPTDD